MDGPGPRPPLRAHVDAFHRFEASGEICPRSRPSDCTTGATITGGRLGREDAQRRLASGRTKERGADQPVTASAAAMAAGEATAAGEEGGAFQRWPLFM